MSWKAVFDNPSNWAVTEDRPWPMDRVVAQLGADHVEWVRRQRHPLAVCQSRAQGAWDANQGDNYAAYTSLCAHLRAEQVVKLRDRASGNYVWLSIRDGVVVGAMGSDPKRFVGLTEQEARRKARFGQRM